MTALKRILVGTDGSQQSSTAARFAHAITEPLGGELTIVSAFRPPSAELSPDNHARLLADFRATLESAWLPGALQGATPSEFIVRSGDPRELVLAVADSIEADLIVLGRGGGGGVPGLLHVGSVVEFVAHHSSRPVGIVPEGFDRAPGRLLVGVDGSAESQEALRWAIELAETIGTPVTPIAVRQPPTFGSSSSSDLWEQHVLADLVEWLDAMDASIEDPVVTTGHAVATLIDTCIDATSTLIVGAKGVGGFTNVRVGGVAMGLLHHAPMPLIIVPQRR